MLRAAVHTAEPAMPPWPKSTAPTGEWRAWLRTVWSDTAFQRAVAQASPHLADQVQAIIDGRTPKVRRMRRAALSTARYAIRYARRSTPYGLFAGVAPLGFAQTTSVHIGDEHQAVSRPEPTGLEEMLTTWESESARMADVEVCVNNLIRQRDQHIHVPSEGDAAFRLTLNPALRLVLDLARSPIGYPQLSDKLATEFPDVSATARDRLLGELLRVRLLRSSLRAPATVADPTEVLPPAARIRAAGLPTARDLRLDADVRLPAPVLTEVETAATVLARLANHPTGTPTWQRWIERFSEHYGEHHMVPVDVATDPDRGVGFPDGFLTASEPPRPMSRRDRRLLELAGTAAVEGSRTVALTGTMIEELEAGDKPHGLAPHLELAAQLHASSVPALDRGDFRLRVLTVALIKSAAAQCKLSVAGFLARSALAAARDLSRTSAEIADEREVITALFDSRRRLGWAGSNLNQAVKALNSGADVPHLEAAIAAVRRAADTAHQAATRLIEYHGS